MKCFDFFSRSVFAIILAILGSSSSSFSFVGANRRRNPDDPLPNCLVLYSECFNSTTCRLLLDKVEFYCGTSLNSCQPTSLSDCIHNLRQLRSRLKSFHGCQCDENKGYTKECRKFYSKLWHHPCEINFYKMLDGVESTTKISGIQKRTTRSPTGDRIQQYRHQLIGDLGPVKPISSPSQSCYSALNEICLKHISCRELWKIFMDSCVVDAQNQCRMNNRDNCWQSFEGISWTGLGNCTCNDRNSDCHWIRLQTNYNKCIYEISLSGYVPEGSSSTYNSYVQQYENFAATKEPDTYNRQEFYHSTKAPQRLMVTSQPSTTPVTTSTSTTTTTTTTPRPTPRRPHVTRRPPPTRPPWPITTPTTSTTTTTTIPITLGFRVYPTVYYEQRDRIKDPYQNHIRTPVPYHATTPRTPSTITATTTPFYYHPSPPNYNNNNQIMDNRILEPYQSHNYPNNNGNGRHNNNYNTHNNNNNIPPYEQTYFAHHPHTTATTTSSPKDAYYVSNVYVRANVFSIPKSNALPPRTTPRPIVTALTRPPISTTTQMIITTPPSTTTPSTTTTSTTTTAILTTTTAKPLTTTYKYRKPTPSTKNLQFSKLEMKFQQDNDTESTCQSAFKQCDQDETCKWHLSELQMKCKLDDNCVRDQCSAAIRRFARYVSTVLVEPMMFCQCSFSDGECKHLQQWMYPRCLYSLYRDKPPRSTCTHAIKLCNMDSYCQRNLGPFNESCPVDGNKCASKDPGNCRIDMISIRGTYVESPCYCLPTDENCLKNQNLMLPNNPCVEEAMSDYSKNNLPLPEPIITPIPTKKSSKEERIDIRDFTVPVSISSTSSEPIEEEEIEVIEVTVEKPPVESTQLPSSSITTPTSKEKKDLGEKDDDEENEEEEIILERVEKKTKFNNTTDKAKPVKFVEGMGNTTTVQKSRTTTRKFDTTISDAYMTQAPPLDGGCRARNIEGDWINHYKNTLVRQYTDWSGRCSFWCECTNNETLECEELPCLHDGGCKTDQTSLAFGERLYLENRGACMCQSGKFICDTPMEMPELEPGLYITAGYSKEELKFIKQKVPKSLLERAGLVSPEKSFAKDITSRLQFALERVMPKNTLCRIVLLEEYLEDGPIIVTQLQWYGLDPYTNASEPKWHVEKMAKTCAPFVRQLEQNFVLERTDRYQLVLSTIKQLRVIDLLDGLPLNYAISLFHFNILGSILFLYCLLFCIIWVHL